WWRIRNGEAKVVIGARSAIFAPLENLGIIIIDEEHDSSYVSEQSPRYKTLDVAIKRAEYNSAKIVLGSATPALESFLNAKNGVYNLVSLPERVNKRPLPEVVIADMRQEVRRGNSTIFSSFLKEELKDCLSKGKQAMLFLNQRGYSKNVICTECGTVIKCNDCDVSLTYHSDDNSLMCHYCGAKYKMVDGCINCGSKYLKYNGTGTEKVVYELKKMFPNARVRRMDRDTTSSKEGHFKILTAFSECEADILVGTQMIAKGHDFPNVTLVGILDADASLHFSDFKCGERTFQLITQVAGRSGRAEDKGKVVLQTYTPDNFILRQAIKYDYEKMFEHEISVRKVTGFPPFTDVLRVLISCENDEKAMDVTRQINDEINALRLENKSLFRFISCMKAPIKRIENRYRYQIMMRINSGEDVLQSKIHKIVSKYQTKTVNAYVEVNPNNLN
ncbi:MAG: primosomal protein N', partial [Clostridia bacterium]|nr:primosomal protein N' [Clostridia bacterium]